MSKHLEVDLKTITQLCLVFSAYFSVYGNRMKHFLVFDLVYDFHKGQNATANMSLETRFPFEIPFKMPHFILH